MLHVSDVMLHIASLCVHDLSHSASASQDLMLGPGVTRKLPKHLVKALARL